jgi:hypothetical protein
MSAKYPRDLAEHVRNAARPTPAKKLDLPAGILEQLFEQLYFVSLQREEGQQVACRVAFIERSNPDPEPPEQIVKNRWECHPLSQDLEFTARNLVKLSQAVDPWASTLAVDLNAAGQLRIWGLIDQAVHQSAFAVKESDVGPEVPGRLQITIEGVGEIAAYHRNIFLGRLRQNVLVTKELAALEYGPVRKKLYPAIADLQSQTRTTVGENEYARRDQWDASLADLWLSTLSRILIGIRRYGHGGAILLSDRLEGLNVRYGLPYKRLSAALDRVAVLDIVRSGYSDRIYEQYLEYPDPARSLPVPTYLGEREVERDIEETEDEITGSIRFLSSLSRVDGLLWFNRNLMLQGFGVFIESSAEPGKVFRSDSARAVTLSEIDIRNFGTRHRSMMRQCHADPDAVGFVVSQDGDVRAITSWDQKVVIWENIRLQRFRNAKQSTPAEQDEPGTE